ncbi:PTS sugar transporter subunit IIA [bacterium]|nr:PTS sugar transporter subunit IIA [bacterium]
MVCRITDYMRTEWIEPNLKATDKPSLLLEVSTLVCANQSQIELSELHSKLLEREQKASTGADHGVAIPHATIESARGLMVAFGKSQTGIPFAALDNAHSQLFFAVIAPSVPRPNEASYLQLISTICRLMRSVSLREKLLNAQTPLEILDTLRKEEDSKLSAPPSIAP